MKRMALVVLSLLLALACLLPTLSLAEESEEYGEATFVEDGLPILDASDVSDDTSALSEPFIPDELDKVIIGSDDRVKVKKPSSYPYSAIANMRVKGRCGCKWTATGFMVSKNTLLTGAHCIVCDKHGKTASGITMYFGYKSSKSYLTKYNGPTSYWYGTDFSNADGSHSYSWEAEQQDYAYIVLEKDVGDKTGWFGMRAASDEELLYTTVELAGYRMDAMKTNTGYVDEILTSTVISITNDALPGNSGSPVFTSDYYALAIWVAYYDDLVENHARRITGGLIREMQNRGLFD